MWSCPSSYPNKFFKWHYYSPRRTPVQNYSKSMYKCRSYGPDKLNLWPFYHLTFMCDLDLQPIDINVSNSTTTPQGEQLSKIILQSMHICRSYGRDKLIYDHFISWPSTTQIFPVLRKPPSCSPHKRLPEPFIENRRSFIGAVSRDYIKRKQLPLEHLPGRTQRAPYRGYSRYVPLRFGGGGGDVVRGMGTQHNNTFSSISGISTIESK